MKRKYTNTEIGLLADAFKKSPLTIKRWIQKKDERLESDKARKVLSKQYIKNI